MGILLIIGYVLAGSLITWFVFANIRPNPLVAPVGSLRVALGLAVCIWTVVGYFSWYLAYRHVVYDMAGVKQDGTSITMTLNPSTLAEDDRFFEFCEQEIQRKLNDAHPTHGIPPNTPATIKSCVFSGSWFHFKYVGVEYTYVTPAKAHFERVQGSYIQKRTRDHEERLSYTFPLTSAESLEFCRHIAAARHEGNIRVPIPKEWQW